MIFILYIIYIWFIVKEQLTNQFFSHIRSKKACNAKAQGQISVEKYFKTSDTDRLSKRQSYPCQGLSSDEIKQYVLKCPSDFGGSKNETELACQLFPQKFSNGHLVYSKLSYSERQELYKAQRAHASWILDRGNLSVTSAKCKKFTHHESKICEECNRLKNNSRFRDAISAVCLFLIYNKNIIIFFYHY